MWPRTSQSSRTSLCGSAKWTPHSCVAMILHRSALSCGSYGTRARTFRGTMRCAWCHGAEPAHPTCACCRVKPIGVMHMLDQGERDDKLIAVHADDPAYCSYNDVNDLPKHM